MKNVNYLILNVLLFFCLNVQAQYFNIVPNLPFKSLGTSAKVVVPREPVSYTHLRAHETVLDLVCRLLLEKKQKTTTYSR